MKLLFLTLLALAINATLHAQEAKLDAKLLQRALAYNMRGADTLRTFPAPVEILAGSRVQTLPQDGMPCIVPDTKGVAAIPNALLKKPGQPIAGQIPNAWKKQEQKERPVTK
jgi:hypothetical protein